MAPPGWTCACCCDTFNDYTSIDIDGSLVCFKCVCNMFDNAIRYEHCYPPRWSSIIHPSEFGHLFTPGYIAYYEEKEWEYLSDATKRVYCCYQVDRESGTSESATETCGQFMGLRWTPDKPNDEQIGRCKRCQGLTCMICDASILLTPDHDCPGESPAEAKLNEAFAGLVKGRHYQECPNDECRRRIELLEACNHIDCQCGTGFCYICGEEADGDSDHWYEGGCPRYNHPDDEFVEYDDNNDEVSENGDESGSSDGSDQAWPEDEEDLDWYGYEEREISAEIARLSVIRDTMIREGGELETAVTAHQQARHHLLSEEHILGMGVTRMQERMEELNTQLREVADELAEWRIKRIQVNIRLRKSMEREAREAANAENIEDDGGVTVPALDNTQNGLQDENQYHGQESDDALMTDAYEGVNGTPPMAYVD